MYKGWKLLTKQEREHLRKFGNVTTTSELEDTFKKQAVMRKDGVEPCWECHRIARKLGYQV